MNQAKYRISRITAEGFRAFTQPQTIEIYGRNAFVFGVNGQGKSSLIEAIRWALFGSPSGRDIEVRNTFYEEAQCVVTLELISENGSLEITRELRPGTNSSKQTIRDSAGNIVSPKDVLPQLARIGHQEGTQVIFAAQHAAGRQAQVDITDFTRVLCFYLRLERVPEMLEALEGLIEERSEEYRELAQKVESAQGEVRSRIQEIQTRLTELLRNPPWGDGTLPTGADTEAKIVALAGDATTTKGVSTLDAETSKKVLGRLKHELESLASKSISSLRANLETSTSRLRTTEINLGLLSQARDGRASLIQETESLSAKISELIGGETLEAIRAQLADLERSMTERDAALDLAERAKVLCAEYGWKECPVCGCDHSASDPSHSLESGIQRRINDVANLVPSPISIETYRQRLTQLTSLEKSKEASESALATVIANEGAAAAQILGVLPGLSIPINIPEVSAKIEELRLDVAALTSRRDASQGEHPQWIKRIRDLEQELVFHEYRDELQRLQLKLTDGMSASLAVLRQYQELLATTTSVKNMLGRAFDTALDRAVPPLEKMLTEVFQRLTQQLSYDEVRIFHSPEPQRRRELRVAAARLPNQAFQPNVLNGQASKALQLVPYFVFSKFQPEVMELDLLLIDDPSESFDTSHVADLIKELALAGSHAQLFVASHEREKFEPHLDLCFDKTNVTKISVTGFSPIDGPRFSVS